MPAGAAAHDGQVLLLNHGKLYGQMATQVGGLQRLRRAQPMNLHGIFQVQLGGDKFLAQLVELLP